MRFFAGLPVFTWLWAVPVLAQDAPSRTDPAEMTVGIGGGLDFGGLGSQISTRPEPPLNLFAGVGYTIWT